MIIVTKWCDCGVSSGFATASRWTATVSVSGLVAMVFCLQMASARWKCLVQKNSLIPPAAQRELQQQNSSAAFAFTVTSIEGRFQKAWIKRYFSPLLVAFDNR